MNEVEVRTARPEDRREVIRVLAAAFENDPVVRWLCPDGRGIPDLFRLLATYHHAAPGGSDLAVLDGRVMGGALWDPPGHRRSLWQEVASAPLAFRALRTRLPHAVALERAFAARRPAGALWYLAEVGAAAPGRGVGSALLAHRLSSITGPAYLESSSVVNIPLYERFGFIVTGEFELPWGGPPVWPMLRA